MKKKVVFNPFNGSLQYVTIGTGSEILVVANYSALPTPNTVSGQFYWCSISQGTRWLPGSLGGTYYSSGLYYSNGSGWSFLDVPYQSTQLEVNIGLNGDKFVTPLTLTNSTQITSKLNQAQGDLRYAIKLTTVIPTALSTDTMIASSNTRIIFTGIVFGKVLNLGNATTYTVGKTFYLFNNSTQTISIVNNSSSGIYRLEPYCKLEIVLENNSIANGSWVFILTQPTHSKFVLVHDDFIAGSTSGESNFNITSSGGGTGVTQVATLFGRQGVTSLSTGTTSSGRTSLNKGGNIILFDNGVTITEIGVRIDNLSTITDRYTFSAGFGDNIASGDHLDGVYFEYAEGTSGNFWRLKTSNNGIRTTLVTSYPILANTWYKLKIEVAYLGSRADFFVDDTHIGFINTNIPTASDRTTGNLLKIEKTSGGNNRFIYCDYVNLKLYIQR